MQAEIQSNGKLCVLFEDSLLRVFLAKVPDPWTVRTYSMNNSIRPGGEIVACRSDDIFRMWACFDTPYTVFVPLQYTDRLATKSCVEA